MNDGTEETEQAAELVERVAAIDVAKTSGGAFPLEGRSRLTCLTTAEAHTARAAAPAASWVGELRLLVDAQVIGSLKKKRTLRGVGGCEPVGCRSFEGPPHVAGLLR